MAHKEETFQNSVTAVPKALIC